MWGKADRTSENLKRITVITVFLLVLLQLALFLSRTFGAMDGPPSGVAVTDTLFIRDTVYLPSRVRDRTGRRYRETEGGIAAGNTDIAFGNPGSDVESGWERTARSRVQVEAGADRWKWDVVELNSADSAQLDELPGIGGYFARGILRYRERLGGFVSGQQLMEIRGMDSARFVSFASMVSVDTSLVRWIDLSADGEDTLARHPYIGRMAARGIVRLRNVLGGERITPDLLVRNGIMDSEQAGRLWRYVKN